MNSAEGRRLASALIAENPDASLREIAKASGVSRAPCVMCRGSACSATRIRSLPASAELR